MAVEALTSDELIIASAIHEAGHVVVAIHFGRRVKSVEIGAGTGLTILKGHVTNPWRPRDFGAFVLAGNMAEEKAGLPANAGYTDRCDFDRMAATIAPADLYLAERIYAESVAKRILSDRWSDVCRVVIALLCDGHLSGDQLASMLR